MNALPSCVLWPRGLYLPENQSLFFFVPLIQGNINRQEQYQSAGARGEVRSESWVI